MKQKILSCIVVLKRIKKFIPDTEYLKLYNALFRSHICYSISSWGGISKYKLEGLFAIQKRCVRLLFGNDYNFDHTEYYQTCARARTFEQHISVKNYVLEHTKPIFNEKCLLSLHHLYIYHTFLELFKIFKYKTPISLYNQFTSSGISINMHLIIPETTLELVKHNFVFQASSMWNKLIDKLMNKCIPNKDGLIIEGSAKDSDLATPVSTIKTGLRGVLIGVQKLDTAAQLGWRKSDEWLLENFMTYS